MSDDDTTHFGYETVRKQDKAGRVGAVFDSVAGRYDIMNDLMSFGVHRLWKRYAAELTAVRPGQRILDLAGGTGDLARLLAPRVGQQGHVTVSDINAAMLNHGRERLTDAGLAGNIDYVQADAQQLPFADNSYDVVTIGFGLRNVTDPQLALTAMTRCLKPGGRLLVLEFSKPTSGLLKSVYDTYSFRILPALGKQIADDADSYRYLAESIRMHPDQETLLEMLKTAGLVRCEYFNLTGGIVAVHRGFKP